MLQLGRIICREGVLSGNLPLLRAGFLGRQAVARNGGIELGAPHHLRRRHVIDSFGGVRSEGDEGFPRVYLANWAASVRISMHCAQGS